MSREQTPAKLPYKPNYPWTVVGLLWFICFLNYADRVAIGSVFPLLEKEFHFTGTQLGWIGSAFAWVYALTAPIAGPVSDRYPRKWIIIGGLYVWSIVTGFTVFCKSLWQFIFVRGAEGLGETFYFPASMSLVSDYHTKSTRSRAMSFHQTSVYAGTIGGSALAGLLGKHYGWQAPFYVFGIAGVILGLFLARFIREPARNEAERLAGIETGITSEPTQMTMKEFLIHCWETPTAILLVSAFFGANFVAIIFITWMPKFLKDKYHLDLAQAGLNATVWIQVASMVGAAASGLLADRWRSKMAGGRILTQSLGLLLGAPFIFLCGYTRDMRTLVIAMILFGLCKGLYDGNIWASLYDVVPASRRGAAVGMMNMIAWTGGALGPLAVGYAVDHGVTMSVAISSTALIYTVFALFLVFAGTITAPRDVRKSMGES